MLLNIAKGTCSAFDGSIIVRSDSKWRWFSLDYRSQRSSFTTQNLTLFLTVVQLKKIKSNNYLYSKKKKKENGKILLLCSSSAWLTRTSDREKNWPLTVIVLLGSISLLVDSANENCMHRPYIEMFIAPHQQMLRTEKKSFFACKRL